MKMSKPKELNEQERLELAAHIQYRFELFGEHLSVDDLAENFKTSPLEMRQHLEEIKNVLEARKIPFPTENQKEEKEKRNQKLISSRFDPRNDEPDPTFIMVAQSILDLSDTRSVAAKLKEFAPIGVNSKAWTNWLKKKPNQEYFDKLLNERFDQDVERNAKLAMSRNMAAGDLPTIKYYYELTNKYRPQSQNNQSVALLMQMMLAILVKHVPMEIIDTIADELEELPVGQQNLAIPVKTKD